MKVFIIYTSAGTGHKKAAEALYQAYKQKGKGQEVEFFNALDYTNSFFKWFYGASYLLMITYLPSVWGFFYFLLDFPPIYFLVSPLRKTINFLNSKRLRDKLIKDNPEVVISVHFFASQVVGRLIAKGFLKTKLITVLTDFLPHSFWINHLTHFYCVAIPQAKERLVQRGVAEDKIKVLGIPINPLFLLKQDKTVLRKRLNFRQKTFIVLIVSGGFGVGPLEKMLHYLNDSHLDIDLAVVCGRNPLLFKRLKEKNFRKKVNIFGFVDNMHEIMKASDLIITKSGGLSISEALVCKLPILIVRPVPGQETRNCFVLTQHRLAIKIKNLKDLQTVILNLMRDKTRQEYLKNIRAISHPQAAFDIIEFADSIS